MSSTEASESSDEGLEPCRLCGSSARLQKSHILPEFIYAPIYDERHKGYSFDPLDPENARKFQKGLREKMLCRACEQFLNDAYEKPFKALWFDKKVLAPLETRDAGFVRCDDYASFKLFHLSVLLRADLATRPEFGEVKLGTGHRDRLREMVRNKQPGEDDEYPVVCMAIANPGDAGIWWDLVSSPNPGRVYGVRFYQFTFGGCGWLYFVSSHSEPRVVELALRVDGTMPVIKRPWAAIRRWAPHAKPPAP